MQGLELKLKADMILFMNENYIDNHSALDPFSGQHSPFS